MNLLILRKIHRHKKNNFLSAPVILLVQELLEYAGEEFLGGIADGAAEDDMKKGGDKEIEEAI